MAHKSMFLLTIFICITVCFSAPNLRKQSQMHGLYKHQYGYGSSSNGLGGAVAGFIFGPILFILSFICIWNNERKAAIDHRRYTLARKNTIQVNPNSPQQISSANGQLVHITGDSQCNETLTDSISGVALNGVIKFKREVQVRQIREHGSDRNRSYDLAWVSSNVPVPGGGYSNDPGCWFISNQTQTARSVYIGNYLMSQSLKEKLPFDKIYNPTIQEAYNVGNKSNGRVRSQPVIKDQYMYFPVTPGNLDAPGTLRIKYSYCNVGETSIISQSSGNTFVPYRIDILQNGKPDEQNQTSGSCCCFFSNCTAQLMAPIKQINLITQTKQTSQQMITNQHKNVECLKNGMRVALYFLMVISICCFFSPITTLIGYVPFLGGFLSGVVGFAIFLAALIVCIPLFLLAVAISWTVFHPKVGLIILAVALLITGIVLAIVFKNKGNQDAAQAQTTVNTVKHLLQMRSFLRSN